jgi:hypothetical protein
MVKDKVEELGDQTETSVGNVSNWYKYNKLETGFWKSGVVYLFTPRYLHQGILPERC